MRRQPQHHFTPRRRPLRAGDLAFAFLSRASVPSVISCSADSMRFLVSPERASAARGGQIRSAHGGLASLRTAVPTLRPSSTAAGFFRFIVIVVFLSQEFFVAMRTARQLNENNAAKVLDTAYRYA